MKNEKQVEINIQAAKELTSKEAIFLDVRESEEIALGVIPKTKFANLGDVINEFESVDKENSVDSVVIYCKAGIRSLKAVELLQEAFPEKEFFSLTGGIDAWMEQSEPIAYLDRDPILSPKELNRYSRQIILPEIGLTGQEKLSQSKVLIVGLGGLGSPTAFYLAAAGVPLSFIDADVVDVSNLQRQIIHTTDRVDMNKADSAAKTIKALNPDLEITVYKEWLDNQNAEEIISKHDLVIDGTDSFPIRYLINDVSYRLSIPVVSASILGFTGQITSFIPNQGPCYRCLYPSAPPEEFAPNCSTAGVLGAMAGTIGTMQATEAVKILINIGKPLNGRLMVYDALQFETNILKITADPACPTCGENKASKDILERDYQELCALAII